MIAFLTFLFLVQVSTTTEGVSGCFEVEFDGVKIHSKQVFVCHMYIH